MRGALEGLRREERGTEKSDALSFFFPQKVMHSIDRKSKKNIFFLSFDSSTSRGKKQTMLASARPRAPLAHAAAARSSSSSRGRGRSTVRAAAATPTPPPSPKKKDEKESASAAAAALISSASLAAFVTPLASHAAATAAAPEAAVDGAVNSVVEVVKVRV